MPLPPAPAPFTDADYEMIAAAVLETARGRWFMSEHARRNRQADTRLVLDAIEKLERMIVHRQDTAETERMRVDLVEMMNAITRTKTEIAAIRPRRDAGNHFDQASMELDAIVGATEKATSDILATAERVQEIASTLREQGIDTSVCDLLDANTTEFYTACSFQDLTGQRIRKVIEVLRFLEARIDAMIKIWGLDDLEFVPATDGLIAAPTPHAAASGNGLRQGAVDEIIGHERKQDVFWRSSREPAARDPRNLAEFDLDDLEVFEKSPEAAPELDTTGMHVEPERMNGHSREATSRPEKPAPEKTETKSGIDVLSLADRMALFA
jgi:chemotaxis regulatin CheY-phosphate phosphatase CheZ